MLKIEKQAKYQSKCGLIAGRYVRLNCSYNTLIMFCDLLCGLVVRVRSYKSRGPGFDSRLYQIFRDVIVLERVTLRLVRITEEVFEVNVAAHV
jgi:hypothetical protein